MNLQQHAQSMGTNYGPWKHSASNFIEGMETGTDNPDGTPKKKSFWKSVGDAVKNNVLPALQSLLTGRIGSIDMGKNWPTEPVYNDAADTLDVGRHLIQQDKLRRFRLGNEYGSQSYNDVFLDGFEDPTALTFKVEFGEWGASITDMADIAEFQKSSLISNTWMNDYDSMPMGLMDLNFMPPTEDYRGEMYDFNKQMTYNAANYLFSRNQDRRAQYLMNFVEGLYVLQKDFPYLFQKIVGIDKLADFDAQRGQRLKDVTLKLQCLSDGIDLKLRTLLELYRKAAWDDVYQRWALPDIHRYFKMIIYIFDRRAITMNPGLLSPDTEFSPIIAYECGPCEFVIKSEDRSDYSQNYFDDSSSAPTIDIKVHNVKTFMVNKMFQRIKFIKDVMTKSDFYYYDPIDEATQTDLNGQNIAWQFVWMQKMFMLPDEFALGATWNAASSRTAKVHYFGDWNDDEMMKGSVAATATIDQEMDETWHYATVKEEGYVVRNFKDLWDSVKDVVTSRTQLIRDSRTSNRYYFVNDLARLYDEPYTMMGMIARHMVRIDIAGANRDLRHRIRQLVRALMQWQLDMNLDKNCLPMVDISLNLEKLEEIPEDLVPDGGTPPKQTLIDISINDEHPCTPYVDISANLSKMEGLNKVYITGGENPKQEFVDLDIRDDKPCEPMIDLSINEDKPKQELIDLSIYDDKLKQDFINLDMYEEKPCEPMVDISLNLETYDLNPVLITGGENPKQDYVKLDPYLKKMNKLNNVEITGLENPEQALIDLLIDETKPCVDMLQLDLNLDKPDQELQQLLIDLHKNCHPMVHLQQYLSHICEPMFDIIQYLDKNQTDFVTLDQYLDNVCHPFMQIEKYLWKLRQVNVELFDPEPLPGLSMVEIFKDIEKQCEPMVELIKNLEKSRTDLQQLQLNLQKPDMQFFDIEKNVSKTLLQMTDIIMNLEKVCVPMMNVFGPQEVTPQQMFELIKTLNLPEHQMADIEKNLDKVCTQMNEIFKNLELPEHQMTDVVKNLEIAKQQLSGIVQNLEKAEVQMQEQEQNLEKPEVALTELQPNLEKTEQNMQQPDLNLEKPQQQMQDVVKNLESPEMNLREIDKNTEIPEVQLTGLDLNLEHTEQQMNGLIDTEKSGEMNMTSIIDNDVQSELKNIPIDQNTEIPEMQMSQVQQTSYDFRLKDVRIDENIDTPEMQMNNISQDTHETKLKDVRIIQNEETPEMNMNTLDANLETPEQSMHSIEISENNTSINITPIEQTEKTGVMNFVKPEEPSEHSNMTMSELVETEKSNTQQMNAIEQSEKSEIGPMQKIDENTEHAKLPPMTGVEHNNAGRLDKINDNVIGESPEISAQRKNQMRQTMTRQQIEQVVSEELRQKIRMLVNLDEGSIEKADFQQLANLVGILEDTVNTLNKQQKMIEIEGRSGSNPSKTMVMTGIVQDEWSAKREKKILDVTVDAYERGREAYKRANTKDKH